MAGSTAVTGPLSPGGSADRRGRRRRVLTWALVALLAAAVAWGAWWVSHPSAFHAPSAEWSHKYDNADMETIHVGMAYPKEPYRDSVVRLAAADPVVLKNTADAEISVHVCHERDGIGLVGGDLAEWCTSILDPAEEPTLRLAPEARERLILTISPRQPGTVRIVGIDLTYRHDLQYGTQTVGEHVLARFQAPTNGQAN